MITEAKAKKCVTHCCCDCHQFQIQEMKRFLRIALPWIERNHSTTLAHEIKLMFKEWGEK